FNAFGYLASSGTFENGEAVDISDAGGTVQVGHNGVSGVNVTIGSTGTGGPQPNTAGLAWLVAPPHLDGDFDISVQVSLPSGVPAATQAQMPIALGVMLPPPSSESLYVRLETSSEGIGFRGLL